MKIRTVNGRLYIYIKRNLLEVQVNKLITTPRIHTWVRTAPHGRPNLEVGYIPAMPRREDHEVHKGHEVALGGKKIHTS